MMFHLKHAYEADIRFRLENERVSPEGTVILAKDIGEGIVYDKFLNRSAAFF